VRSLRDKPGPDFHAFECSDLARHQFSILAGHDANQVPGVPAQVAHGESLHHEFGFIIEAGLSNLEVLRVATVECANCEVFWVSLRLARAHTWSLYRLTLLNISKTSGSSAGLE
jgi:hypothetical protein